MKPRKLLVLLALAIVSFGATTVIAQASENPNIARIVDGARNPEKIHYATKGRALLLLYDHVHRQGLASLLSQNDTAVIEGMVGAQKLHLAAEQEQYNDNFLGLCSRMEVMDVESLATEYLQQAEQKKAAEAKRYREGISKLSREGQAIVNQYIDERVTPGIKTSETNEIDDAKSDPELYRFNMRLYCHVKEHGELPPWAIDSSIVNEDEAPAISGDTGKFNN